MMLEVLAFPVDTNDVANGLDTMERKIKEFERHDIPEFLKVGIVIRQTGRGTNENAPHHECAQVDDVPGHQSRSDECRTSATSSGDESVDSFSKGSPRGASKGTGNSKDSEVVCWYCEKKGHRAPECRKRHKGVGKRKSTGAKKSQGNGAEKARNGSKANVLGERSRGTFRKTADQGDECVRGGGG